jgi:hypothetical protein
MSYATVVGMEHHTVQHTHVHASLAMSGGDPWLLAGDCDVIQMHQQRWCNSCHC